LILTASAQSGRVAPTPTPSPSETPAPEAVASPEAADTKPRFVVDPTAPKYKLVFQTKYKWQYTSIGTTDVLDIKKTDAARIVAFVDLLNEAGAEGYRVVSVTDDNTALLKLDEAQYEYAGYETDSRGDGTRGLVALYGRLGKEGFRLASVSHLFFGCEIVDSENLLMGAECLFKDLFLFERQKGATKPIAHKFLFPRSYDKWDVEMTAEVRQNLEKGLYPARVVSKDELLLEQFENGDDRIAGRGAEVQVVKASHSYWGRDDLSKKVNLLAKQGYRLALINYQLAVMYRDRANGTPTSYVFLQVGHRDWMLRRKPKEYEKDLAKLQQGGAVYRMTYPNVQGDVHRLVFEENASTNGKRREYRILRFELVSTDDKEAKTTSTDLTSEAKANLMEFNRLVSEGFEARDLFVTDVACVLLERMR
jgi:hypothetical protein